MGERLSPYVSIACVVMAVSFDSLWIGKGMLMGTGY